MCVTLFLPDGTEYEARLRLLHAVLTAERNAT